MNGNRKYWIWLSEIMGAGARVEDIFSYFSSAREVYEADRTQRIVSGVFTRRQIDALDTASLRRAENAIEICDKNGWKIYTPEDKEYPELLHRLPDRPLVLFVDGDISCLNDSIAVGVVGTRKPSYESVAVARKICADMAAKGAVTVSGGALGIDSAAHEGAIEGRGKTVCVMGCGLGCGYLRENEALRREIAKNGALITEYLPFTEVTRYSFPARNRIISGVSHGVLVIEAGEKSGSLITARRAVEQGREVFAVPGSILTSAYTGVNRLIRDGAKVATCADDILSSFALMYPERLNLSKSAVLNETETEIILENAVKQKVKESSARVKKPAPDTLDSDAKAIYGLFGSEPIHADELCVMSGLPVSKVLSALMMLEFEGLVEAAEGKNYRIK